MFPCLLRRVIAPTVSNHCRLLCSSLSYASASSSSQRSTPGNPLMRWPSPSNPEPDPSVVNIPCQTAQPPLPPISCLVEENEDDADAAAAASTIAQLLRTATDTSDLNSTLLRCGAAPSAPIVSALLRAGNFPSAALLAVYRWARPQLNPTLLVSFVDLLAKCRAFDSAWSLLIEDAPFPLLAFAALFRRYARASMPSAAVRVFEYVRRHPEAVSPQVDDANALELLVDALCKEGHPRVAAELLDRTRKEASAAPSVRVYNMLLHGWFRARDLSKAERLWDQMKREGVLPTVVTYGTLIEGLCRMRRPDQALDLLEEMRAAGIEANPMTCNPIIDALSEDGNFKEALGMLEKFPLYGVSPSISTFNSLVKGFCKKDDLVGASKVLKMMIGRGILPSPTTYNYFFRFFSKSGKIEEAMNLYTKMIQSGYFPDRLTYELLIKMLCEKRRLGLAVWLIKEMSRNGFDLDLDTSTMLVHLLCRIRKFEKACAEFEGMIRRGIVPQYITYRMLVKRLKLFGMLELERKVSDLMKSVRHSTNLPKNYRKKEMEMEMEKEKEKEEDLIFERRKSILKKAEAMSGALKKRRGSKERTRLKSSIEKAVESANALLTDIRRRVYAV